MDADVDRIGEDHIRLGGIRTRAFQLETVVSVLGLKLGDRRHDSVSQIILKDGNNMFL